MMDTHLRYYRIVADPAFSQSWFLGEVRTRDERAVDGWLFTDAVPYKGKSPVAVPIEKEGIPVQFNFASFDVPIVTASILEQVLKFCGNAVEAFPVEIESAHERLFVLNVLGTVPLDESHSKILRWSEADGRPDKVGKYRMVTDIKIDHTRTMNRHLLRIAGWEVALVISEQLRAQIEPMSNLGVCFLPV